MADYQKLITTLAQGLKNQIAKVGDLQEELKGFEDVYSKDYKIVNDRIDAINVQIDKTIKDAIKSIEFPPTLSEDDVTKLIKEGIKNIDEDKLKKDLEDYIEKHIPPPQEIPIDEIKEDIFTDLKQEVKKLQPKEIDLQPIYDEIEDRLKDFEAPNVDEIKKSLRAFIAQKVGEIKVKDGQDGVGIEDIKRVKDELVITLTDGTEKKIKLPKPQVQHVGGGGGVSAQNATSVQIVSAITDIQLSAQSQNVLANTTNGKINVTMPNPANCFFNNRSFKIGITKIDSLNNKVTILPFNVEMIALETSVELLGSQEVLNFITDGQNWYLGS